METTRRILNAVFWVAVSAGLIWLAIMSFGGGFPVFMGSNYTVKFDVSKWGWQSVDPSNGTIIITHEKNDIREGWGALQFSYKFNPKKRPGIYSTSYGFEGLTCIKVWMKSKNPCMIGLRLKDKKKELRFLVPLSVDKKWRHYTISQYDIRDSAGVKGKLETARLDGFIEFADISRPGGFSNNTIWIDHIEVFR